MTALKLNQNIRVLEEFYISKALQKGGLKPYFCCSVGQKPGFVSNLICNFLCDSGGIKKTLGG